MHSNMNEKNFKIPNDIGGPIQWKAFLPVPIVKAFNALDTDKGRASFWAESAILENDEIEFHFINGSACQSKILERDPPNLWVIEYLGGVAKFELSEKDDGTELLLTHSGVPDEEWIETYSGWLTVLLSLKAWIIYDADLRNHDPNRTWNEGYVDQ
jgi:hypothetical protein